jgi:agmatinase
LGPRAVLEASRYVELYDQELDSEPAHLGICTVPALELTRAGAEEAMAELESAVATLLEVAGDRFMVILGGEHSISAPVIRAHAARSRSAPTVLQLDAHADLRDEYEGSRHSHACAMARAIEHARVVAVGVRGISQEEVELARSTDRVSLIYADRMWESDAWMEEALQLLEDPVYLTFDVDYFDPALVPSTGTPEPGGGDWYRTLRFLRRVFAERDVIGADVVELAPIPGFTAPDFLVAKLVYKLFSYRFSVSG